MYMTNGLPVTLPCIVPVSYPPAEIKWVVRKGNGNLKPVNLDLRVTMDLEGDFSFVTFNQKIMTFNNPELENFRKQCGC